MSVFEPHRLFDRYVGIDYSGAATPVSGLPGLRVYVGERASPAAEHRPRPGERRHWSRRGIAEWLLDRLREPVATLVGIDHGFSFPREYFAAHRLPLDWPAFLDDFRSHWPTDADDTTVEMVRRGLRGRGRERGGDARWRRLAERAGAAKSVFHFDVQGSVAKSTHGGLPWLLNLRRRLGARLHFWPFDGWTVPPGRSVVLEVYPSLWSGLFPRGDRGPDQHDAYSVVEWMRDADGEGRLAAQLAPALGDEQRAAARYEGWILGVPAYTARPPGRPTR
jgi:hypothetical protein